MSEHTRSGTRLGATIGRYRISRLIGGGKHGRVFECRDPDDRAVAVKIMRSNSTRVADKILRDRLQFEKVRSPNAAQIFDVAVFNNAPYVVMELVDGESVAELRKRGVLRTIDVLQLARAVATGMKDLWACGFAHGDLRAANVLVPGGDLGAAKIVDVGMAPPVEGSDTLRGTPEYMAPELLVGTPPDMVSDLYAFGCTIYEIMSGFPPFRGAADVVLKAQSQDEPQPLDAALPGAPHFMVDFVDRLLVKDRAKRIKTWAECLIAIEHAEQGSKLPPPPKPQIPVPPPPRGGSHDFESDHTAEVHSTPALRDLLDDEPASAPLQSPLSGLDLLNSAEPAPSNELMDLLDDDPFGAPPSAEAKPSAAPPPAPAPRPAPAPTPPPAATPPAVTPPPAAPPPKPSSAEPVDSGSLLDDLFSVTPRKKR